MKVKRFSAILAVVTILTMLFSNVVSARTISNALNVTYRVISQAEKSFNDFKNSFISGIEASDSKETVFGVLGSSIEELDNFDEGVRTLIINDINNNPASVSKPDLFGRVIPDYKKLGDIRKSEVAAAILEVKTIGYYKIIDEFDKYVQICTKITESIENLNKNLANDVKMAVDNFNSIFDTTDYSALQAVIDKYLLDKRQSTIKLTDLIQDYRNLSDDEKLAVARKILNGRKTLGGERFLGFYEGDYAFLTHYAEAVKTIKELPYLLNLTWDGSSTASKTITVVENEGINLEFRAKTSDPELTITNVRYVITIVDSSNAPVGTDVIGDIDIADSKIIVNDNEVSGEETQTITFTFKAAGTYSITIYAEN